MPIEENTSNIDFAWRFNNAPGQEQVAFSLRLHETDQFGWTLTFLDEQGEPSFSFPVNFLSEVGMHIQQYLPGHNTSTSRKASQSVAVPPTASGLSLPDINRMGHPAPSQQPQQPQQPYPQIERPLTGVEAEGRVFQAVQVEASDPIEDGEGIFMPEGHSANEIEIDPDALPFETFTVTGQETKILKKPSSDDVPDRNAILQERQDAKAKAKGKGIKSRHVEKTDG